MKKYLAIVISVLLLSCTKSIDQESVEFENMRNHISTANMFKVDFKIMHAYDYSDKIKIEINRNDDITSHLIKYRVFKTDFCDYHLFVENLVAGQDYRLRLKLNTGDFETQSEWIFFETLCDEINFNPEVYFGSVSDIDGNTYRTVVIDSIEWMAENLRVRKFNDGTELTRIYSDNSNVISDASYCFYNNNESLYELTYGALYAGSIVDGTVTSGKNICPVGWHIPSVDEWTSMHGNFSPVEKKTLAEKGERHWIDADTSFYADCGFTSLPGGMLKTDFEGLGLEACYISSEIDDDGSIVVFKHSDSGLYMKQSNETKMSYMSVRCVKD